MTFDETDSRWFITADERAGRLYRVERRDSGDLQVALEGEIHEHWEAHEHGRGVVITISPLDHNWAVRFCSHAVYPDLAAFADALRRGEVEETIAAARSKSGSSQP